MITLHIEAQDISDAICTLTLMGPHIEGAFEVVAIKWLKERGYQVEEAKDWETPREIAERLHITTSFLSEAIRRKNCPAPLDVSRGPTGRIIYLRSTPSLDAFLTRHLNQKH